MIETTAFVSAIGGLLGVLIWPALIIFLIVRYHEGISSFFSDMTQFSVKAAGVEASAVRQREIKAAVAVGAAVAKREGDSQGARSTVDVGAELADKFLKSAQRRRGIERARLLWVDDRPDNNIYEREALEALGARIQLSTSTHDALSLLRREEFDVVISDMGRPPDSRAGYTLLDEMRRLGDSTPFVIYAGSRSRDHNREAQARGAVGTTNSPQELIGMVSSALAR